MKRDKALVPLSRQHHHMLILAQVLKLDVAPYQNMPKNGEEKLTFLKEQLKNLIIPNFKIHREVLYPALIEWSFSDPKLMQSVKDEEQLLLSDIQNLQGVNEEKMHEIGLSIEQLVRIKERELYQKIQEDCAQQLEGIALA